MQSLRDNEQAREAYSRKQLRRALKTARTNELSACNTWMDLVAEGDPRHIRKQATMKSSLDKRDAEHSRSRRRWRKSENGAEASWQSRRAWSSVSRNAPAPLSAQKGQHLRKSLEVGSASHPKAAELNPQETRSGRHCQLPRKRCTGSPPPKRSPTMERAEMDGSTRRMVGTNEKKGARTKKLYPRTLVGKQTAGGFGTAGTDEP